MWGHRVRGSLSQALMISEFEEWSIMSRHHCVSTSLWNVKMRKGTFIFPVRNIATYELLHIFCPKIILLLECRKLIEIRQDTIFSLYYLEDIYGTIKYPANKLCAGVRGYYFCVATLTNELGEVGLVTKSRLPRPLVTSCTLLTWAARAPSLFSLLKPLARCHNLTWLTDCRAREICRSLEK